MLLLPRKRNRPKGILSRISFVSFRGKKRYFSLKNVKYKGYIFYQFVETTHPRRPRGSQSGREKRRDRHESFQVPAKEPLGTDSHRAISKNSSGCRLLIGRNKCFVLLCPIGEQFLLSSSREFVHDGYCFDHVMKLSV